MPPQVPRPHPSSTWILMPDSASMAAAQQGEVLGLITGYTLSSLGISSNIDRPPDHKASMTPPSIPTRMDLMLSPPLPMTALADLGGENYYCIIAEAALMDGLWDGTPFFLPRVCLWIGIDNIWEKGRGCTNWHLNINIIYYYILVFLPIYIYIVYIRKNTAYFGIHYIHLFRSNDPWQVICTSSDIVQFRWFSSCEAPPRAAFFLLHLEAGLREPEGLHFWVRPSSISTGSHPLSGCQSSGKPTRPDMTQSDAVADLTVVQLRLFFGGD